MGISNGRPAGSQLETLTPPLPSLPSLPRRRSHLDSASYRTLVRILSHCPHESQRPRTDPKPIPDRNPNANDIVTDELGCRHERDPCHELSKDPVSSNPSSRAAPDGNSASELHFRLGRGGSVNSDFSADPVSQKPQSSDYMTEKSSAVGDSGHGDRRKENEGCEDGGIQKGRVFTNPEVEQVQNQNFNSTEQSGNDGCADSELLSDLIFDAQDVLFHSDEELLDGEISELQKDTEDMVFSLMEDLKFGKSQEQEDGCDSITFPKASTTAENSKSIVYQVEMRGSPEELRVRETREEEHEEQFYSEAAKGTDFEKTTSKEAQIEKSQSLKKIREGMQEEIHIYREPAISCSGLRKLQDDQISPPMGLVDDEEIEDGEIPDGVQIPEDQEPEEDLVHDGFAKRRNPNHALDTISNINCIDGHIRSRENKCKDEQTNLSICDKKDGTGQASSDYRCLNPQMKRTYSNGIEANAKGLRLLRDNSENLAIQNTEEPPNVKDVEAREKKRRGPLTEERKAKKKNAKKRKRAQKDREQGVKRLKLQPNVKPKVVKYCNFYMMGRCQQGDLCKFSHDTTPLTKSQPCKYFACDSCLKGEDCPFDHQLSKYPCHNYMAKGMCIRGDRCKFSHKMSVTEGPSTLTVSQSDSTLSSEKPLHTSNTSIASLVAIDPHKSRILRTPLSTNKQFEANKKEPIRVPNGIQFLSFGKSPLVNANKQDKSLIEKHGGIKICNQVNQEKILAGGHSHANMKSGGIAHHPINSFGNKESKNCSFSSGSVVAPFSRSLQNEVSDATKILDEFLFGGSS